MNYEEFISSKGNIAPPRGFEPNTELFPQAIKQFQRDITALSCRRGKSAIFAATGLGKTIQELSWLQQVATHAGAPVLMFSPLGVARQIVEVEAPKFGFSNVSYAASHADVKTQISVTNYERRDKFDLSRFAGIAMDESGIIKNHDSATFRDMTEACAGIPYLLCATATPAPNDWTELGQHSEFLGIMTAKEMLATYFVHDGSVRANGGADWRLKRHAEQDFWRWLASWSVMIRHPRDIGHDERGYDLPPLDIEQVVVKADYKASNDLLFPTEAVTLQERLAARRDSVEDRVAAAARIVAAEPDESWLIWCHLNKEADLLTRAIHGAVNVQGSDKPDDKVANLLGFSRGSPRILVSKPSIAGRGMNFQNCNRMIFVGLNDSFEELFQAVRRCWRFGQTQPVKAYLIASELEGAVVANLMEKERKYERMADAMVAHMRELMISHVENASRRDEYSPEIEMRTPTWLAA